MNPRVVAVLVGALISLGAQAGTPREIDFRQVYDDDTIDLFEHHATDQQEMGESRKQRNETGRGRVDTGINWVGAGIQFATTWQEYQEAYDQMNGDDAGCEPDFSSQPMIPSSCPAGSACESCYRQAYGGLNFVRGTLERLRCIHRYTDNYVKKAIAFGDNVSGIHAVQGLAWQHERRGIEASFVKFGQTYDRKYAELMRSLQKSLHTIGSCEAQHFNNPDWYDRYGYIYYTFMADKYRRP